MAKFRKLETLEDFKNELPKIKLEWNKLKLNKEQKFPEYTDELILELENLLFSENEDFIKITKAFSIIAQLDNIHFMNKLDLESILNFCRQSQRIYYFIKYQEFLNDKEYWKQLSNSYIHQDYSSNSYELIKSLFSSDRKQREKLMTLEEQKHLNNLPEKLTIYRAMSKKELQSSNYRLSWTLNKSVASKFVERNELLYNQNMEIKSLTVNKKNIIAYLNARHEEEIIYIQKNGDK